MPETPPAAEAIPRSVRLFAPWTWRLSRRECIGLCFVALAGYVLLAGVLQYFVDRLRLSRIHGVSTSLSLVLHPPRILAQSCPYLATIHREEWMTMCEYFGFPTPPPARTNHRPLGYSYTLHHEGGMRTGRSGSFHEQRDGKLTAISPDGHLIVNDVAYGKIPDGASIAVEKDGRVLINGLEKVAER